MDGINEYRIEGFPSSRIATIDIGDASNMKHHIKALIEVDVTNARRYIREQKGHGIEISFNAWLIKCVSTAVQGTGELHAIRKGKRKMVIFKDVDISIMVEREVHGKKVPLPYVIRRTNEKSISEISKEIRSAQAQAITDEGDNVLGKKKSAKMMRFYYHLPGAIRRRIWKWIITDPFITKNNMGTVMISSVGMVGKVNGWVLPFSVHPLSIAVGSIIEKPGVVEGRIEVREYLHITVSVDHDVIDGAPAVRALSNMTKMMEEGDGLN
jgi:pyruvate/2-oxoglutarate dehydrogenase complex dihydrolipoamide acyltransferase (E2) component